MTKVKRNIIKIDEDKCNGCGLCVPSCKEGALQIVDGKAKLVSEVYCDGLGACLGNCPQGALEIIEKNAEDFDEELVLKNIKNKSLNNQSQATTLKCGCPGTMARSINPDIKNTENKCDEKSGRQKSELRQWPVQLHLIPVNASYLKNAELVLMADCTAIAYPNIHSDFIKNKALAIACPKLDETSEYAEKLALIIKENNIKKIQVIMMEVPCCRGLMEIAENAVEMSNRGVILKETIILLEGKKLT